MGHVNLVCYVSRLSCLMCLSMCVLTLCKVASFFMRVVLTAVAGLCVSVFAQAEDKEALLRKQAREARYKAAELSDKARRLRALAQKGVNNVMEATQDV